MTYAELKADLIGDLTLSELTENNTHRLYINEFTREELPYIAETLTHDDPSFPFNVKADGKVLLYQHKKGTTLTMSEVSDLLNDFRQYLIH